MEISHEVAWKSRGSSRDEGGVGDGDIRRAEVLLRRDLDSNILAGGRVGRSERENVQGHDRQRRVSGGACLDEGG